MVDSSFPGHASTEGAAPEPSETENHSPTETRSDGPQRGPDAIWAKIRSLAEQINVLSLEERNAETLAHLAKGLLYYNGLFYRNGEYRYINLNSEHIRVLKVALSANFGLIIHLTKVVWPEEYSDSPGQKLLLMQRFMRIRRHALKEIPRVLANPDLEDTLTQAELEFYDWLRENFGPEPYLQVRKRLKRIGQGHRSTTRRGDRFVLGKAKLRVMGILLFEDTQTDLEACRLLWPDELAKDPDVLSSRFSHLKARGLKVMEEVLAEPHFYGIGLPEVEVLFYERVVAKFGTANIFEGVRRCATRH